MTICSVSVSMHKNSSGHPKQFGVPAVLGLLSK